MKIKEILEEYQIETKEEGEHHHARRGWIQVDCPYCHSPGKFRLGLGLNYPSANCWNCGKLHLSAVLAELLNIPENKARKICSALDKEYTESDKQFLTANKCIPPDGLLPDLKKVHTRYLKERKFDPDKLQKIWGIQGIGLSCRVNPWSIYIPITHKRKVVSWTTRKTGKGEGPRYNSAKPQEERIHHKTLLGGEQYVRDTIIVTEGPFDAFNIGPGAIWTSGLSVTTEQIVRISKYPIRVICFDSSDEAQVVSNNLCEMLYCFDGKTYNVCLDANDPGSASSREIKKLRRMFLE